FVFDMGDFDADGTPDLAVADGSSTWIVFGPFAGRMDLREAAWRIEAPGGAAVQAYALGTGDLDLDGLDDLAIAAPYAEVPGEPTAHDELRIFFGRDLAAP